MRRLFSIGAVSLLALVHAHAQAPQSTFQAEVNLIEVDAAVTDADGNFVCAPDGRRLRALRRWRAPEDCGVIVLDDLNIAPIYAPSVRQYAREFVESYFGAGDIGAVTYTSGRVDASQEFTSDAQRLLASID
jgi:hypothetical protein